MLIVFLLLEQVVNVQIHLEDGLFTPFVVQGNDESTRGWGGDIEVDIRSSGKREMVSPSFSQKGEYKQEEHIPIIWDVTLHDNSLLL